MEEDIPNDINNDSILFKVFELLYFNIKLEFVVTAGWDWEECCFINCMEVLRYLS